MNKKGTIVLAVDIERAGATNKYDTIGIGASVINENLEELDSLFIGGYKPEVTKFEPRCWEQFWSKNEKQLKILEYNGEKKYDERQKEMIQQFQQFRREWETYAREKSLNYYFVSNNKVFDGGFINMLIFDYCPQDMPIPYAASDAKYSTFFETHSVMKGLLMAVDPEYKLEWGFFSRICELYDFPKAKKQHDHHPANDAYTIAYEFQILRGIQEGRYHRKKSN